MLPHQHRLPLRFERNRLEAGSQYSTPHFTAYVALRPSKSNPTRFGLIISKKIYSKATDRNRLKRQISAQILNLLPNTLTGYDLFIIPKKSLTHLQSSPEINQSLITLFSTAKLLQSHDSRLL